MHVTSGDSKELIQHNGKSYQIYYNVESEEGRGICRICGRRKRYFKVTNIVGIEEYYGDEIKKDSDLGKEITESLKRVVRRETICDHCRL